MKPTVTFHRCAAVLLAALLFGTGTAVAAHAPKLVCEQRDFDFGTADKTATVTHVFLLQNAGDAPLILADVRATCSCTTATVTRTTIPPGETAEVTAIFKPDGRFGPQQKRIVVNSNDPALPMSFLTLRGMVMGDFQISPDRLTAGRIGPGQVVEMNALFVNNLERPVHVTRAMALSSNLQASVLELAEGRKYRIVVKTVPPLQGGTMESAVRIFTDSTNQPVVEIPFTAAVQGALVFAPPQLELIPSSEPISRFVIINGGAVTNFTVVKVESPDPAITTQQMKFGLNGVRVMVNNLIAQPGLDGKVIKITTDVDEMREILIPIHVLSAAKKP